MIIDNLNNSSRYLAIHQSFEEAFQFIERSKAEKLPVGYYSICGEEVYANIEEYDTINSSLPRFEMHRNYIDIHCILEGEEAISYDFKDIGAQEKVSADDCYFMGYKPEHFIILNKDSYAIFLPYEWHMPKCNPNGVSVHAKKVIVKIKG